MHRMTMMMTTTMTTIMTAAEHTGASMMRVLATSRGVVRAADTPPATAPHNDDCHGSTADCCLSDHFSCFEHTANERNIAACQLPPVTINNNDDHTLAR